MGAVFAAIDVGSYEIAIKIFEVSGKGKLRTLDMARRRIDLGTDSYTMGRISSEHMDELCDTLNSFKQIMDTYKVDKYLAYATSAIRELPQSAIVLDQIRLRTGLKVNIIANSEQRFYNLKSIAVDSARFEKMIDEGAAILDIGGGSVQISIFENASLIASQNLDLGILRMRDRLRDLFNTTTHYERYIEEIVDSELHILRKLYLKENPVKNLILVDDYVSFLLDRIEGSSPDKTISAQKFSEYADRVKTYSPEDLSLHLGVPVENAELILTTIILIKHFTESTGADSVWMPGVTLSDGIGYEFAQMNGLLKAEHDFSEDILSCARNISKRYKGSRRRGNSLEMVSLAIFDSLKKSQKMGKRDRLLLQLACILQDCGKYISTKAAGHSGYNIIMNTEILGISKAEKLIVANVVRASYENNYSATIDSNELSLEETVMVSKLTAIIITGLALARSQKKWFSKVSCSVKDKELILSLSTQYDITLERRFIKDTNTYFQDVYGMDVVIKGVKARQGI